jgi:integrase
MFSTGHSIDVNDWKKKKVGGMPKEKTELLDLIQHLKKLSRAVEEWSDSKLGASTLNREDLKRHLSELGKDEQKEKNLLKQTELANDFFTMWENVINSAKHPQSGMPITARTKLHKRQSLKLVKAYCVERKFTPTLLNIDLNFYHSFDDFMQGRSLVANTRGKHFKEIKAYLREALERDHEVNRSFQKKAFKVIREDVEDLYLSIIDIKKVIDLEISSSKRAELRAQVVTACFTGLRQSDWGQHDERNIIAIDGVEMLKIKPLKTGQFVYIPLHPVVRSYLKQYGRLRNISNQKMNVAIKEFAKDALVDKKGSPIKSMLDSKEVDKYQHISSHSCRRSFCTNAYLSKSIPTQTIMKISGHKSESSFLKYLKLGSMEHGLLAAESKFFSEWTTLKVA